MSSETQSLLSSNNTEQSTTTDKKKKDDDGKAEKKQSATDEKESIVKRQVTFGQSQQPDNKKFVPGNPLQYTKSQRVRSEERRVGKEGRSRGGPCDEKKEAK